MTGSAEAGHTRLGPGRVQEGRAGPREHRRRGCRLPWQLLAAIGKVESGQARGGQVDANGTTLSPILGPALNGQGFALHQRHRRRGVRRRRDPRPRGRPDAVHPVDLGHLGRGRQRRRRARTPTTSTTRRWPPGATSAPAAATCRVAADLDQAVLSYNHSTEYLRTVRSWFEYYQRGTHEVPDGTGVLPATDTGSGTSVPVAQPLRATPPAPRRTPPDAGARRRRRPTTPRRPSRRSRRPPRRRRRPPTTPDPAETFGSLENAGTGTLTATAGEAFTERVKVRAKNELGAAARQDVGHVRRSSATRTPASPAGRAPSRSTTGADGTVTAPVLTAGREGGRLQGRATVAGTHRAAAPSPSPRASPPASRPPSPAPTTRP